MKGELLTVAIAGVEADEISRAGIGIARGLRRVFGNRMRIIGLSRAPWRTPTGADGEFDVGWGIGHPDDPNGQLAHLLEVDARFGVDVVLPSQAAEAVALVTHREMLRQARIAVAAPSTHAWERVVNVGQRSSRELGMRPLETVTVADATTGRAAVRALGLPLLMKTKGHAEVVHSPEAAAAACERLLRSASEVILQKHPTGEEYDVAVVRDGATGHFASVTLRKTLVTRFGQVWSGVTATERSVHDVVERTTSAFDWHGACELEVVRDQRGVFWLREFAPSLPSWHELGVAAGVNLALALFYIAVGRRLRMSPSGWAGIYYAHRPLELIDELGRASVRRENERAARVVAPSYL